MNNASQYTDMNLALAASEAAEDVVRYESLIIKTLSRKKKRNRTTIPTDENARGLCFRTRSIPSNGYNRKSCETKGTIPSQIIFFAPSNNFQPAFPLQNLPRSRKKKKKKDTTASSSSSIRTYGDLSREMDRLLRLGNTRKMKKLNTALRHTQGKQSSHKLSLVVTTASDNFPITSNDRYLR